MNEITKKEHEEVVARVAKLLALDIDAVELSRLIRIGAFDLCMHALDTEKNNVVHADTASVVFYLNEVAEALHPVMSVET